MFRSKIVKGFVMGLGLAMALSTAAFAEQEQDEEFTIQITNVTEEAEALPPDAPVSSDGQAAIPIDKDGAAVSGLAGEGANGSSGAAQPAITEPASAPDSVSKEMYDRQLEADRYLFADHTEEIAAKGITVTHTAATNEYVEIGITPFSKENAEFIYEALGRDKILVVEGAMNAIFETGAAADDGKVYKAELYNSGAEAVSAPVDDQRVYMTANTVSAPAESTNLTAALSAAAAAVVLLGGALFIVRRRKMAKN